MRVTVTIESDRGSTTRTTECGTSRPDFQEAVAQCADAVEMAVYGPPLVLGGRHYTE